MGESEDPDVSEKSQWHFPIAEEIITIARSHHVKYLKIPKVPFYAYIYDLNSDLDISKDRIEQATKKNKNNMHVNFASTHTMNFIVADADLVYKVHKVP